MSAIVALENLSAVAARLFQLSRDAEAVEVEGAIALIADELRSYRVLVQMIADLRASPLQRDRVPPEIMERAERALKEMR